MFFMRNVIVFVVCLMTTLSLFAAGIDCRKMSEKSPIVEKEICGQSNLRILDTEVSKIFDELKKQLRGEQRDLLIQTQRFFLRERNKCQNQDTQKGDFRTLIRKCIELKYQSRSNALKNIKNAPDSFLLLVKGIESFDVKFIKVYGSRLIGQTVSVVGTLLLDEAKSGSHRRIRGLIKDQGVTLPVIFTAMPPSQAEFLDQKKPFSHHEGMIDTENNQIVIRITSLLGTKLSDEFWDPTGDYFDEYDCDAKDKARGYSSGSYNLVIKEELQGKGDQKYQVSISLSTCPSGHMCGFEGTGQIQNGILVALAREAREGEDKVLQKDCKVRISKHKDGGVIIDEVNQGVCEEYFWCGAFAAISRGQIKKK